MRIQREGAQLQIRGTWSAGSGDDQARFLADLRALRDAAVIGYDELSARAHYPSDVLKEAENGPSLPGLPILSAYVRACEGDVLDWEERWRRLNPEVPDDPDLPVRPAGASAAAVAGARAGVGVAPPDVYDPDRIRAALRGDQGRTEQASRKADDPGILTPAVGRRPTPARAMTSPRSRTRARIAGRAGEPARAGTPYPIRTLRRPTATTPPSRLTAGRSTPRSPPRRILAGTSRPRRISPGCSRARRSRRLPRTSRPPGHHPPRTSLLPGHPPLTTSRPPGRHGRILGWPRCRRPDPWRRSPMSPSGYRAIRPKAGWLQSGPTSGPSRPRPPPLVAAPSVPSDLRAPSAIARRGAGDHAGVLALHRGNGRSPGRGNRARGAPAMAGTRGRERGLRDGAAGQPAGVSRVSQATPAARTGTSRSASWWSSSLPRSSAAPSS